MPNHNCLLQNYSSKLKHQSCRDNQQGQSQEWPTLSSFQGHDPATLLTATWRLHPKAPIRTTTLHKGQKQTVAGLSVCKKKAGQRQEMHAHRCNRKYQDEDPAQVLDYNTSFFSGKACFDVEQKPARKEKVGEVRENFEYDGFG